MTENNAVQYVVRDAVAWIRMNRPDSLNAFNQDLRRDLSDALRRAGDDASVKVVVLGAEGRAFSAGADLMEDNSPDRSDVTRQLMDDYRPILESIQNMPKPVIGVAPGVAAGIGASVLMSCDQVVMADTSRIYLAFSHIGLIPDGGGTWLLFQTLGYHRAFALITEGGSLSAQECLALGLARAVVPQGEEDATAAGIAATLCERSSLATAEAKRLLRQCATASYAQIFEGEAIAQKQCLQSEESREAIAKFKNRQR
ncbi:2-(1,2-epoxy-1,2-dihydrophenyl)acetyl-CoA isomerase [Marinobacter daqiaonensis]|uniref:2-(1,2-epoxy-1,2-dihydrophenyl)acetyl-CoA isomerase n=1 Tax=Marinobacter daqiaonensis TaxID=650891 RepID=A0A1I6IPH1_9GAMM|nr:enoyl-CoA hydratase-related protein [Marinobacter daqiaonensis]SFR68519.1 2-(1,2-epoxy-1,2-dihydrophenyl)acetyl-CoA isomerase [Marinobacter daqiaonensis]